MHCITCMRYILNRCVLHRSILTRCILNCYILSKLKFVAFFCYIMNSVIFNGVVFWMATLKMLVFLITLPPWFRIYLFSFRVRWKFIIDPIPLTISFDYLKLSSGITQWRKTDCISLWWRSCFSLLFQFFDFYAMPPFITIEVLPNYFQFFSCNIDSNNIKCVLFLEPHFWRNTRPSLGILIPLHLMFFFAKSLNEKKMTQ